MPRATCSPMDGATTSVSSSVLSNRPSRSRVEIRLRSIIYPTDCATTRRPPLPGGRLRRVCSVRPMRGARKSLSRCCRSTEGTSAQWRARSGKHARRCNAGCAATTSTSRRSSRRTRAAMDTNHDATRSCRFTCRKASCSNMAVASVANNVEPIERSANCATSHDGKRGALSNDMKRAPNTLGCRCPSSPWSPSRHPIAQVTR